jgi:hypothetical protein
MSDTYDSDISESSESAMSEVQGWKRPVQDFDEPPVDLTKLPGVRDALGMRDPRIELVRAKEQLEYLTKLKEEKDERARGRSRHPLFWREKDDYRNIGRSKFAISPAARELLAKATGLSITAYEEHGYVLPRSSDSAIFGPIGRTQRFWRKVEPSFLPAPRKRVNRRKVPKPRKKELEDFYEEHLLRHGSLPKDNVIVPPKVDYAADEATPQPPGIERYESNWSAPVPVYQKRKLIRTPTGYKLIYQPKDDDPGVHPLWIEDLNHFWVWRYRSTGLAKHKPPPHVRLIHNFHKEKDERMTKFEYEKFKDRHPKLFRSFKWPMSLEEMRKFYKPEFRKYNAEFWCVFKQPGPLTDLCYRAALMNLYGRTMRPPVRFEGLIRVA